MANSQRTSFFFRVNGKTHHKRHWSLTHHKKPSHRASSHCPFRMSFCTERNYVFPFAIKSEEQLTKNTGHSFFLMDSESRCSLFVPSFSFFLRLQRFIPVHEQIMNVLSERNCITDKNFVNCKTVNIENLISNNVTVSVYRARCTYNELCYRLRFHFPSIISSSFLVVHCSFWLLLTFNIEFHEKREFLKGINMYESHEIVLG